MLLVIPALALQLGYIAWQIPNILQAEWNAIIALAENFGKMSIIGVVSAVVQILFLLLPAVGVSIILFFLGRALLRFARRAWNRRQSRRGAPAVRHIGTVYVPRPTPREPPRRYIGLRNRAGQRLFVR